MAVRRVHLILHCDALSRTDANTFEAAAHTLAGDYRKHYSAAGHEIKVMKVLHGQAMKSVVTGAVPGSIVSLDIVSHGNQGGIHIAKALPAPVESGFLQRRIHVRLRRQRVGTLGPQTEADAEFIEESMEGLYSNWRARLGVSYFFNQTYEKSQSALLDELRMSAFDPRCFLEFHGCKTAEVVPVLNEYFNNNFAKEFSGRLGPACTTVGHIVNSAPDKNPNGNENDYRYGRVRVYRGGNLVQDAVERWGMKLNNSSTP